MQVQDIDIPNFVVDPSGIKSVSEDTTGQKKTNDSPRFIPNYNVCN